MGPQVIGDQPVMAGHTKEWARFHDIWSSLGDTEEWINAAFTVHGLDITLAGSEVLAPVAMKLPESAERESLFKEDIQFAEACVVPETSFGIRVKIPGTCWLDVLVLP